MSTNNILRIFGIAGILSAVLMVVGYLTMGPNMTMTGISSIIYLLMVVTGIIFVIGLYQVFRSTSPTLALIATAASVIGYALFLITVFTGFGMGNPLTPIADILAYIVGMGLFSWLAYSTGKMPRILGILGLIGAAAGAVSYVIGAVTGGGATAEPTGIASIFFYIYFLGVLIWLIWSGYCLVAGKAKAVSSNTPILN